MCGSLHRQGAPHTFRVLCVHHRFLPFLFFYICLCMYVCHTDFYIYLSFVIPLGYYFYASKKAEHLIERFILHLLVAILIEQNIAIQDQNKTLQEQIKHLHEQNKVLQERNRCLTGYICTLIIQYYFTLFHII